MTYKLPSEWLPACRMSRVILHWSAGAYRVSDLDREHYHFIVDGNAGVVRGEHSIADNVNTADDDYAAHTRGCNTGSIGVSMACMAGATEVPFRAGSFPMKEIQWRRAAEVVAHLVSVYKIDLTDKTVLTHAEVQPNLGIRQNGKWDVTRLPFDRKTVGAKPCGDAFRALVRSFM
ncbi:MAG: peptidoglycan recognition family protein [Aquidulcibacter sp.]